MKLNTQANQIRNLHLFDDKRKNYEIKKEILNLLKKESYYHKNEIDALLKRKQRRVKMRNTAERNNALDEEDILCPFPEHKGYSNVREMLSTEEKKQMLENFKITEDGKIEVIKMHKKISILEAKPDNDEIIDGDYKDKEGNEGIKGIIYFSRKGAVEEAKKQNKKIFNYDNKNWGDEIIMCLPGKVIQNQIEIFRKLLELEKTGYFNISYRRPSQLFGKNNSPYTKITDRIGVKKRGYLAIGSDEIVFFKEDGNHTIGSNKRYRPKYFDDGFDFDGMVPYIAYEDC